ncbi:hypothetical protein McanMca71_006095 [Microsporum canis]|uniref:Ubiquitin carboxyl-terminal hydrolase 19 n=1 Tax=Arthroderma otae (strain ATCC MYA-4605 / CBS 113480) TaxID=554155 RepID=C5FNJ0_ARTOC|nr:conserved hypothetical protein [Microsporum canis CBS 113480]EEQ31604.1 conserved hypothetical protein [Microsporum canis CBS 113480]
MDAQYPFATREDIWRVHEEVKDLCATQAEHSERLAKLERRKEDDAKMKSLWSPFSPIPSSASHGNQETVFNAAAEPFKGFDQAHHGLGTHINMDHEDEPRRGASRANSVRFDESAMHGYNSHGNRSAAELAPARTGSGMGAHPLTERSYSHRSDGRQSSSGHSHHSVRTYSLETSRVESSSSTTTPASQHPSFGPPPGLFILGPVPCIIRCWLTTSFSNDSLLYAAICTGSYSSAVSYPLIQNLGLEDDITVEDGARTIKLPVYFPEASVCQSSSRSSSPEPHLPALTVRFFVREIDQEDHKAIPIFIGSDVLRVHNADILFSQDKMYVVDDARNRISIPLVRPEDHESFRCLVTMPDKSLSQTQKSKPTEKPSVPEASSPHTEQTAGVIGHRPSLSQRQPSKSALSLRTSEALTDHDKDRSSRAVSDSEDTSFDIVNPKSATSEKSQSRPSTKSDEGSGHWGSWRRDAAPPTSTTKPDQPASYVAVSQRPAARRNMKVLKPTKTLTRSTTSNGPIGMAQVSSADRPSSDGTFASRPTRSTSGENGDVRNSIHHHSSAPWPGKSRPSNNPIGGASAFGWLNTQQKPNSTTHAD